MSLNEKLEFLLKVNADQAIAGFKAVGSEAEKNLKKAEDGSKNMGATMTKVGAGMVVAAGAVGAGLFDLSKKWEEAALSAGQMADATGLTTEQASRWSVVAKGADVDTSALEKSIGFMNKTAGKAPQKFTDLGISLQDANGHAKSTNDLFLGVIDALNRMPDPQARAAAGAALLGKGWMASAELVREGTGKITADLAAVNKAQVHTEDDVAAAKALRDSLKDLGNAAKSLEMSIGAGAAPVIETFAKGLTAVVNVFDKLNAVSGGAVGQFAAIGAAAVGVGGLFLVAAAQVSKLKGFLTTTTVATTENAAANTELAVTGTAAAAAEGELAVAAGVLAGAEDTAAVSAVALEVALTPLAVAALAVAAGVAVLFGGLKLYDALAGESARNNKALAGTFKDIDKATDVNALKMWNAALLIASFNGDSLATANKRFAEANLEGAQRILDLATANGENDAKTQSLTQAIADQIPIQKAANAATAAGKASQDAATAAIDGATGATDAATGAIADLTQAYGATDVASTSAKDKITSLADATRLGADAFDKLTQAYGATDAASVSAKDAITSQADATRLAGERDAQAAVDADAHKTAVDHLVGSIGAETTKFDNLSTAANTLKTALDSVFGGTLSLESANQAYNQGIADLNKQVTTNTTNLVANATSLDVTTEAGNANRKQIESNVQTILTYAAAQVGAGQSNEAAATTVGWMTDALKQQLVALGFNADEAQTYIDTLGLTPDHVTTAIKLAGDAAAKAKLATMQAQLTGLGDGALAKVQVQIDAGEYQKALNLLTVLLQIKNAGKGNPGLSLSEYGVAAGGPPAVPTSASGTSSWGGGLVIIGDNPSDGGSGELVDLPAGSVVHSAADSRGILHRMRSGLRRLAGGTTSNAWGQNVTQVVTPAAVTSSGVDPAQAAKDAAAAAAQAAQDTQDSYDRMANYLYHTDQLSEADYIATLDARKARTKEWSAEYVSILQEEDDIKRNDIDREMKREQDLADANAKSAKDQQDTIDRMVDYQFNSDQLTTEQYAAALQDRLNRTEAWSAEYITILDTIAGLWQKQYDTQKQNADLTQATADAGVKAAFDQTAANVALEDAIQGVADAQQAEADAAAALDKVNKDRTIKPADRPAAVASAEQKIADTHQKTVDALEKGVQARAGAAGYVPGTPEWAAYVADQVTQYAASHPEYAAELLHYASVGVPHFAGGGIVKGSPNGRVIVAGENNVDEAVGPVGDGVPPVTNVYHYTQNVTVNSAVMDPRGMRLLNEHWTKFQRMNAIQN